MSHWIHKLDIHDAWVKSEGDGDFKALSKVIIEKLAAIDFGPHYNEERDGVIEAFQDLIDDSSATMGEFDSMMDELYDFGDIKLDSNFGGKKLMWVNTF